MPLMLVRLMPGSEVMMKLPELWQAAFDPITNEITFKPLPDFEVEVRTVQPLHTRFRWVGPWMDEMPAGIGDDDVQD